MVFREEHKENFTIINNNILKDKELSLASKGLLITMLSLPDDWSYSTLGLASITKESKNTIHRLLKELENKKYLIRKSIRDSKGKFIRCDYLIYELPYLKIRDMELPDTAFCDNINNLNNKDENDKTLLSDFTKELINRKYISETDFELEKYDRLFNELKSEYDYKLIYVCTNYIIKKLEFNNYKDENNNPVKDRFNYLKTSLRNNLNYITTDYQLWEFNDL